MPKTKNLTVKQEKFVNEVVQGRSYREVALKAGYSPRTANNASRDIRVKPCVEEELTKRLGKEGISAGYVLSELKRDVDEAEGPNPVRTKSLELMGKHLGLFGEKGPPEENRSFNGVPRERREELFKDIHEIVRGENGGWGVWVREFRECLKRVPEDLRQEADSLFRKETFAELMFARIDLTQRLHILGEEYRRRVPCGHCGKVTVKGAHE